jgi:hypothetical protein
MKLIARDDFSLTNIECVIECQLSSFKMIVKVQNMHRNAPIRSIQQINKSLKSSERAKVSASQQWRLKCLHFERKCFTTFMPMCCVLLCAINTLADQWRVPNSWTAEAGDLKLTLIPLVMPATVCKCFQRVSIMLPR